MRKVLERLFGILLSATLFLYSVPLPVFAEGLDSNEISFDEFKNQVDGIFQAEPLVSEASVQEVSSKTNRLIVKTDVDEIDSLGAVAYVKGYGDLHILQYEDEELFNKAIEYYSDIDYVDFLQEDEYCEISETVGNEVLANPMQEVSDEFGYTALNTYIANNNISYNEEIVVGVVDTGIANDHEFLRERVVPTGFNSIDSTADCYDDRGHGTHVAGIIAANTPSNTIIKPYKALNYRGVATDLQIYLGIMQAVEDDVDIINLSLSRKGESQVMHDAVIAAYNAGIIVVASAGNKGVSLDEVYYSPACFDEVICVNSCSMKKYVSDFSNYGSYCDISAPGENIISAHLNNTYKALSGTSSSAPFVTAAIAHILSTYPEYTFSDVQNKLKENARTCFGLPVGCYLNAEYVTREKEPSKDVRFSYAKSLFQDPFELTLSCADETAEIYYRTSYMVNEQYVLYTEPIPINYDIEISAYTITEGATQSYVTNVAYTKKQSDASLFNIDENGRLIEYLGEDANPVVPNLVNGTTVVSVAKEAFSGNTNVKSVSFLGNMKTIEAEAFCGCANLEYVRVKGVTNIGDRAFADCPELLAVNSPKLESLGSSAFENCSKILSVNLLKTTEIKDSCFSGCSSFANIGINSIVSIGKNAFKGTKVSNVRLNSAEMVEDNAFCDCENITVFIAPLLTEFNIDMLAESEKLTHVEVNNVTSDMTRTFENHNNISYFHADSIKKLPDKFFKGCNSLTDVSFARVESIGEYAFSQTQISEAVFNKATYIGDYAFSENDCLKTVSLDSTETINLYDLEGSTKNIETLSYNSATRFIYDESIGFQPLNDIFPKIQSFSATNLEIVPDFTFKNCKYDVNFDMPSLKVIGDFAFYNTGFTTLYGENIIKIGKHAFNKCTGITEVVCPNATEVGAYAFANCPDIKTLELDKLVNFDTNIVANSEESITRISASSAETVTTNGEDAYLGRLFPNLKQVNLDSLKSISSGIFADAFNLTHVSIDSAEVIGENTFVSCTLLREFSADSLKIFDMSIIDNCLDLQKISLNGVTGFSEDITETNNFGIFSDLNELQLNGLKKISRYLIYSLSGLSNLVLYIDGATEIEPDAFKNNKCLSVIHVGAIRDLDEGVFSGCFNLSSVYAESLEEISEKAFYGSSIRTLVVPKVKNIGDYAFADSSIKDIIVTDVVSVGDYAFQNCSNLRSFCADKLTEMGCGVFEGATQIQTFSLNALETLDGTKFYGIDYQNDDLSLYCIQNFIANKVKEIPERFFKGMDRYSYYLNVTVESVEKISESAFSFSNVRSVVCPKLKIVCDEAFSWADELREIDTENITYIGRKGFCGCSDLRIPSNGLKNLEALGTSAFYNCKLAGSPYQFDNLKVIGEGAFSGFSNSSQDLQVFVFPNVEEVYDIPQYGIVLIGSAVTKIGFETEDTYYSTVYSPASSVVTKQYCLDNNLNYVEYNSQTGVLQNADWNDFNFETLGFNLSYQWYGAYEYDLSDAVPIAGATTSQLYETQRGDYTVVYCIAISEENGNQIIMKSHAVTDTSFIIDEIDNGECELSGNYGMQRLIIEHQGVTEENFTDIVNFTDGCTYDVVPSFVYDDVVLYGTGTVIDLYYGGRLIYSFTIAVQGDVNGDSYVDVLDTAATAKYVCGNAIDIENEWMYDFNDDTAVDISDYQQVANKSVA